MEMLPMRDGRTDGRTNKQTNKRRTREDRATQPMDAGWLSFAKVKKTEIFNFKDKDSLKRFKEITSNNSELSSIFDSKRSVEKQAKQFMKRLNGMLHQCFKKS